MYNLCGKIFPLFHLGCDFISPMYTCWSVVRRGTSPGMCNCALPHLAQLPNYARTRTQDYRLATNCATRAFTVVRHDPMMLLSVAIKITGVHEGESDVAISACTNILVSPTSTTIASIKWRFPYFFLQIRTFAIYLFFLSVSKDNVRDMKMYATELTSQKKGVMHLGLSLANTKPPRLSRSGRVVLNLATLYWMSY